MQRIIIGVVLFVMCISSCSRHGTDHILSGPPSEGMLRIAWRLQTQENVYGFYVYRGESEEGPWTRANKELIPGHDTTSIPHSYKFYDTGLVQGKKYFFYITEITTDGKENTISPIQSNIAKSPTDYPEYTPEGDKTPE